jgi:hypothetical protein
VYRSNDDARRAALQRNTVERVIDSGNDYLITVKGNQPTLRETIERFCNEQASISSDHSVDTSHGRSVERTVEVWRAPNADSGYVIAPEWVGLRRIIRIKRVRISAGKRTEECLYYITSRRETSARTLGKLVQQHWQIENRLHWVKDAILREDRCGIRGEQAAENHSVLTTMALNIYRLNGEQSLKYGIIAYGGNIAALFKLIRT